jgi:hypothetical protein
MMAKETFIKNEDVAHDHALQTQALIGSFQQIRPSELLKCGLKITDIEKMAPNLGRDEIAFAWEVAHSEFKPVSQVVFSALTVTI